MEPKLDEKLYLRKLSSLYAEKKEAEMMASVFGFVICLLGLYAIISTTVFVKKANHYEKLYNSSITWIQDWLADDPKGEAINEIKNIIEQHELGKNYRERLSLWKYCKKYF